MKLNRTQIAIILSVVVVTLAFVLYNKFRDRPIGNPGAQISSPPIDPPKSLPVAPKPAAIEISPLKFEEMTDDYMQVHGLLINHSADPLEFVKIVVTFYDDKERFLSSENDFLDVQKLAPGGRSPFTMTAKRINGSFRYSVSVVDSDGSELPHFESKN